MRLTLSGRHPRNSTYTSETGQVLYKVHKPYKYLGTETATIRKAVSTVNGVWQGDSIETHERRRAKARATKSSSFSDDNDEVSTEGMRDRRSATTSGYRYSTYGETFATRSDDTKDINETGASLSNSDPSQESLEPVFEGHFAFYAQIEFPTFQASRFRYNSLDVSVEEFFRKQGWSLYGRGRVFRASDGNDYRWELRAGHLEMIRNDGSKTRVVRFREWRPSLGPIMKGRPASLEIDPSCEPILDEIILTFVYCHKLRKDREEAAERSGS